MFRTALLTVAALFGLASAQQLYTVDLTNQPRENEASPGFQLKKGDLLKVTLSENPSSGYLWKYENPFEDTQGIFSVEMDDFLSKNAESDESTANVGSGGTRTILLKGEKAGSEDFELILVRSWEFQDFIDRVDANNGTQVKISTIPNVGYRKVTVNVQE